jgi:hypothetical protein
VASSLVWLLHYTLYILKRLFRVTLSEVSKIFTRYSWYVRSSPTVNSSKGICYFGTHKHLLSCKTWKTSCTSDNCGGSSNWYATPPLCFRILNGPIYLGASFPCILKWRSPLMSDTFRYTKSPTLKLNFLLLWSAKLFCRDCASRKFSLTTWTCLSTSWSIYGPKTWFSLDLF